MSTSKIKRNKRKENPEYYRQKDKEYRERHKERINKKNQEYRKKRMQNDIHYNFRVVTSKIIQRAIKRRSSHYIFYKLPYTVHELRQHIEAQWEEWMSWENYGIYERGGERKWHIDHVVPQAKLPYDSIEHENFTKCWSLDNLRPLEAIENIKKGAE